MEKLSRPIRVFTRKNLQHYRERALLFSLSLAACGTLSSFAAAETDPLACITAHSDGQVLRNENKLLAARERFQICAQSSCPEVVRADCLAFGSALESVLPTLRLSIRNHRGHDLTDVQVRIDGYQLTPQIFRQPMAVDPGVHRIQVRTSDQRSIEVVATLRLGEKDKLVVAQFPEPASQGWSTRQILGIGLAGVGVAGLASFAAFGLAGNALEDELQRCAPHCTDHAKAERMRSRYLAADISLGLSVLSLGASAYLLLLAEPVVTPKTASLWRFDIQGHARGGFLRAAASF